jgi:hypothetical protein
MDFNTKFVIAAVAVGWAFCSFLSGRCYGVWITDVENGETPKMARIMRRAFIETLIIGSAFHAGLLGWVLFR